MFGRRRVGVAIATVVVAVTAGLVVGIGAGAAPSEVRLHLGTDGRFFQYGTTTQTLNFATNSCKIASTTSVMNLAAGGNGAAGIGPDNSIGVRSPSGGNGTPCSQIDATESLTLTPGSSLAGRTFSGVRLDLEMTGNAVAKLTLSRGATSAVYNLQTGTSIAAAQKSEPDYDTTVPYAASSSPGDTTDGCAAPNSSGPNSGQNDNCEWTVQSGFAFDTITLTTVSIGSVSLEGGADFGNSPSHDTLFYLSNGAPTANDDAVSTNEDTAFSGNVLTNDSDPDGNPLAATKLTDPTHGAVSFAANGAFTYTPAANYQGTDSFTYSASDGALSDTATVNITVNSVNDPPVAQDDTAEVNQHAFVDIPVLANDSDLDSASLTPTTIGSISPVGATATANGDGTVRYTAPDAYTGPGSFTYKASDGTLTSNTATVSVTVYPAICANDTVSDADGSTVGAFTRLDDSFNCKRYTLAATAADHTIRFVPSGSAQQIAYRAYLNFGPDPMTTAGTVTPGVLDYDPTGGFDFRAMQWCRDRVFDASHNVTSATVPDGESWCIASTASEPDANGVVTTTWQIFGFDDPTARRR